MRKTTPGLAVLGAAVVLPLTLSRSGKHRLAKGLHRRGVVGVALLVSLSILGCGSDAAGPSTPVATTLTLSATVLSFSSFGATEQLTATVRD